jgi:tRNA_anti-like
MKWTGTQRIEGGVADLVLALGVALWVHSRTKKQTAVAQGRIESPKPAEPLMIPLSITPEEMVSIFSDKRYNTNQAKDLTRHYIGKRMQYSGKVHDVYESMIFFQDPKNEPRMGIVRAVFDERRKSEISIFPPGTEITIVGRVETVEAGGVLLRKCEIVKA